LENLSVSKSVPSIPFVSILSSSGTGKTQFAFNISEASKEKVFYLLSSPPTERSQEIYKSFTGPSMLLESCVLEDLKILKDFGVPDLFEKQLFTFGFIYALLKHGFSYKGTALITPMSGMELSDLLVSSKPIVVLDEFMSINAHNLDHLRLLRNSFRSISAKLLIMGTHSAVSNIVEFLKHSRGGDPFSWCILYTKLPQVSLESVPFCSNHEVLRDIARHSRPLFVEIMKVF
jgi:hypothetical protein